jgi:hypothetical protein
MADSFGVKFLDIYGNKPPLEYAFDKHENMELYGRLECGFFEFIGGRIYYNNNVIKVRYDLINGQKALNYKFPMLIDSYQNVFKHSDSMSIALGFPYDSKFMHKLLYVIKNIDGESNSKAKIMILPYLHEQKIYFSHLTDNTNYFMT